MGCMCSLKSADDGATVAGRLRGHVLDVCYVGSVTRGSDRVELGPIWQQRFEFYDRYGHPFSTRESLEAYKALPLWTRLRISFNVPAAAFGPFYFFAKGMWRKGLTVLLIVLALVGVLHGLHVPYAVAYGVVGGLSPWSMASYEYYLHRTTRSQSWNPFEGMWVRRKRQAG